MSLTRAFAGSLLATAARGLDAPARAAALSLAVDGLSVAALGAGQAGPRILAADALETGGRPDATLIGHGERVSARDAARVNGAAMHVLDFEPMWNPANHSLSTVLPALLALAEGPHALPAGDGALGERLLAALAIGVEAQARLRLASSQFEPADLVFHPPGAVGPIGSAAACAVLLGLDEAHLTHAIGIAASRAGGVLANVGSMTKALHCGQAAAAGLDSALLAARGFTADADALAGPRGFGHAFFQDGFRPDELMRERSPLHIVEPGPAYKLYPSQYGTHFVISAARDAHRKLPAGARIRRVRLISPPMPYVDRPEPASGLAGKFSFQYTAAAALLDGTVGVESFTDTRRFAPDMTELLPKVQVEPDAGREGRFDRMVLDIMIELEDGGEIRTRCDGPPGIWGRPADPALLEAKARDCLNAAFRPATALPALEAARRMDGLDRAGVRNLMRQFAVSAAGQGSAA